MPLRLIDLRTISFKVYSPYHRGRQEYFRDQYFHFQMMNWEKVAISEEISYFTKPI